MPVSPYGAHKRLQQLPQPLQTVPSSWPEQFDAAVGGCPQLPSVWPSAISQRDEQHSASREQTSPVWAQNEEARLQRPASHSCEQHWLLSLHSLPAVLQLVLSGTQLFWSQLPLQHSPSTAHVAPSETQLELEHVPARQLSEQHSVELAQLAPSSEHWLRLELQVWLCASHSPEQQSVAV
jgi:hypothetical protein